MNRSTLTPADIEQYYWNHLEELEPYTWFHFVTRMYFVKKRSMAQERLTNFYEKHLAGLDRAKQWEQLENTLTNSSIPTDPDRVMLLQRYPSIRPCARHSFVYFFSKKIWNLNLEEIVRENLLFENYHNVQEELINDHASIQKLATYALNFLILTNFFSKTWEELWLIEELYRIFQSQWKHNISTSLEKRIYFVTHMIINDSHFYTRPVPEKHRTLHKKHLELLSEEIILARYKLSFDCMSEFCASYKLIGIDCPIAYSISNHILEGISSDSHFLSEPGVSMTMSDAEHLNVVFVLAFS